MSGGVADHKHRILPITHLSVKGKDENAAPLMDRTISVIGCWKHSPREANSLAVAWYLSMSFVTSYIYVAAPYINKLGL